MEHTTGATAPTAAPGRAPSPPRRPGARRLAGVAVAMLVVGTGVAAVLVTSSDGGTEPVPADPADPEDPEDPEFALVEGLCESVDYSALDAVYPFSPADLQGREDRSPDRATCTLDRSTPQPANPGGPLGLVVIHVAVYDTTEAARSTYDNLRTSRAGFRDGGPDDPAGGWDDTAVLSERSDNHSEIEIMARDGVLFLNLRLAISAWSRPPGLKAQQAALAEVAGNVREVLRR